jgi:hypothetical protein
MIQIDNNDFSKIETLGGVYSVNNPLTSMFKGDEGFDNIDVASGNHELTDKLMRQAIDDSIRSSHAEYVEDMSYLATLGPSDKTVRDDYRPTVQFYGLRRSYANDAVPLKDAREQPSEPESHIAEYAAPKAGFLL